MADVADQGQKSTIQNLVYQELRRSLMTGAFAPGEKVSLRGLARQMGTSMMPVREAVNRLTAERAFEVMPNRMVIVPVMTEEKFEEITRWRIELECAATRQACHKVTPELIRELEASNNEMIKAAKIDHRDELLPDNYQFHFAIYRASGSEILLPMIESLWLQAGPFTYYSIPSPRALWNAKHHHAVLAALKAKDETAAAAAIKRDIESTADFLKQSGHYNPSKIRRVV